MMPVFCVGWLALGSQMRGTKLTEVSGYIRPPVALCGEDKLPGIDGLTGQPATVLFGGVFDAPKGGRLLLYWQWNPPFCEVPGRWRGEEVRVIFDTRIQQALNRARTADVPGFSIAASTSIGALNGSRIFAACRLGICDGLIMSTAAADARRAVAEVET